MSPPVSQISAAVLPAGTEQLGPVTTVRQRALYTGASGPRMTPILLEHERKVLAHGFMI